MKIESTENSIHGGRFPLLSIEERIEMQAIPGFSSLLQPLISV